MADVDCETERILMGMSLAYATYITVMCPCNPLITCHQWEFYLAAGLPLGYLVYRNHLKSK